MREDGRGPFDLRPIEIEININKWAEGSAFIRQGDTHIICTASVQNSVPQFAKEKGIGWIYAEYSMLPRAVDIRTTRSVSARALEVQRIIGRALRASCDLKLLAERTIIVDCDVVQADGSTRCVSIVGGFVALFLALHKLWKDGIFVEFPIKRFVAAVSVGIVNGQKLVDLTYQEDSSARFDMIVAGTSQGEIVEIQGTAEEHPLPPRQEIDEMISIALRTIPKIIDIQRKILQPFIDEMKKNEAKVEIL